MSDELLLGITFVIASWIVIGLIVMFAIYVIYDSTRGKREYKRLSDLSKEYSDDPYPDEYK